MLGQSLGPIIDAWDSWYRVDSNFHSGYWFNLQPQLFSNSAGLTLLCIASNYIKRRQYAKVGPLGAMKPGWNGPPAGWWKGGPPLLLSGMQALLHGMELFRKCGILLLTEEPGGMDMQL